MPDAFAAREDAERTDATESAEELDKAGAFSVGL